MTYLDDYKAPYKLQGVRLASQLLQRAPPELLRRTGMDVLLSAVSSALSASTDVVLT